MIVRRLLRWWWVLPALLLASGVWQHLTYDLEHIEQYHLCGSHRWIDEAGFGRPGSAWIVLEPRRVRFVPSRAHEDLFPADHEHDWQYVDGWTRTGFLGCTASGHARRNRISMDYQHDDRFRELVRQKIEGRELSSDQAVALIELWVPMPEPGFHRPPLPPDRQRLVALGRELLAERHPDERAPLWRWW
ncbi:MAG: hypothetical protein ACYS99_04305 [Planctomycetota bacterium]